MSRVWAPDEPLDPWRTTTVDCLNRITWKLENGGDINDIKLAIAEYQAAISKIYHLYEKEKWAEFCHDDGIELGCTNHAPFTEKACDRMDIPFYMVPMIPQGAHLWTRYGEEISYDKSIHDLATSAESSNLELRCTY